MGGHRNSPSSSIDSSNDPCLSPPSSSRTNRKDLTTDLRLALSLSTASSPHDSSFNARDESSNWPPIKPLLRSTLTEKGSRHRCPPPSSSSFFVKVYMEGTPIGRKLDLFALDGYDCLIRTLSCMFRTTIIYPDDAQVAPNSTHVLTYEDEEGDWMMVGDVPWELFLTTVKKLKIAKGR
ncbi:auxin-responsive protein IAA4 [Iris pallida]|uniref:Auxin-responsive protein n=1 Tax=Iris pallida TaxID=29817 RepID=A0AAX6F2F9_IRIPA|nr:auxin-responsive protein IAA4 [Iris pallida]